MSEHGPSPVGPDLFNPESANGPDIERGFFELLLILITGGLGNLLAPSAPQGAGAHH